MKRILIALVILQLVLVSKGGPSKKPQKCPRNPKLEAWKKSMRQYLASGKAKELKSSQEKRSTHQSDHDLCPPATVASCESYSMVDLGHTFVISQPLYDCCKVCYTTYKFCEFGNHYHPMVCEHKAHECMFKCRKDVDKTHKRSEICEKKTCDSHSKRCCVEDHCVNARKNRT